VHGEGAAGLPDADLPVGAALPDWEPRPQPSRDALVGRHCRLESLDPERHAFHHVGNTSGVKSRLLDNQAVVQHGRLPYVEVLGVVGGADIGIVFLSEQNFETTTKLFDYLAMGIDVLLCTNGAIGSGAVAGVLEGQEGVFWCRNNAQDAARFIAEYKPAHRLEGGTSGELFTRRHGTRLLAARIIDLVGR